MDIFVLVGQSNMSGRGTRPAGDAHRPGTTDGIWRLRHDLVWQPAGESLVDPDDPVFAVNADRKRGSAPAIISRGAGGS